MVRSLDVFCGADIATLLAEADLVWVARHYLDLPSAMEPPPDTDRASQSYADLLGEPAPQPGPVALLRMARRNRPLPSDLLRLNTSGDQLVVWMGHRSQVVRLYRADRDTPELQGYRP